MKDHPFEIVLVQLSQTQIERLPWTYAALRYRPRLVLKRYLLPFLLAYLLVMGAAAFFLPWNLDLFSVSWTGLPFLLWISPRLAARDYRWKRGGVAHFWIAQEIVYWAENARISLRKRAQTLLPNTTLAQTNQETRLFLAVTKEFDRLFFEPAPSGQCSWELWLRDGFPTAEASPAHRRTSVDIAHDLLQLLSALKAILYALEPTFRNRARYQSAETRLINLDFAARTLRNIPNHPALAKPSMEAS